MSVLYQAPLITNLNMETLKSKYYCVLLLLLKKNGFTDALRIGFSKVNG